MPEYHSELSIEGIQELQAENNRIIAELSTRPNSAMQAAMQFMVVDLERYAIAITHVGRYPGASGYVGGGTLRASHRMAIHAGWGEIFIDPSSVNPRTHQRAAEYGYFEEMRGGSHAFYSRTVEERGDTAMDRARQWLEADL